jgi:hypothetical protein
LDGTLEVDDAPPHTGESQPRPRLGAPFNLPDNHLERRIAASIVLHVGLGIIMVITVWSHWKAARR